MSCERQVTGYPSEISQLGNFIKASGKSLRKAITKPDSYLPNGLQHAILLGLSAIVPDEVRDSGIFSNSTRMKVVDSFLDYQIWLNDRLDFFHSKRNDLDSIKNNIRENETKTKKQLDLDLLDLKSPEIEQRINSGIMEVEHVEGLVAFNRGDLSFDEVEKYRNIVNAISNCTATYVILDNQRLKERLEPIARNQLSWQSIYSKYRWVFGSESDNAVERAVMVMHNLAMGAQVDDDWYGKEIDKLLNVSSFASAALVEKNGDEDKAIKFLKEIKCEYLSKARRLGLGFLPTKTFDTLHKYLAQKQMRFVTRKARFSKIPLVRKISTEYAEKRFGVRERAYARGEL